MQPETSDACVAWHSADSALPVVETSRSGMLGRAFVQVLVLIRSGDAQELTTSNEQRLFQELQTRNRMVQEQVSPFSWHGFCHRLPTILHHVFLRFQSAPLVLVVSSACDLSKHC